MIRIFYIVFYFGIFVTKTKNITGTNQANNANNFMNSFRQRLKETKNLPKNDNQEILSQIPTNKFLAINIPPSINNLQEKMVIGSHTKTSLFNPEIGAQKLTQDNTTKIMVTSERTNFRLFEANGYCFDKADGLYTDIEDCENFIICYAGRTFRTKCAQGTRWNHLRKECDFPEKVDCDRRPTTLTTALISKNSTYKKESTIQSQITRKTFQTKPAILFDDLNNDISASIKAKANIVLISILVPIAFIALVVLILSLWIWSKTFKKQKKQLQSSRRNNSSSNQCSKLNKDMNSTHVKRFNERYSCFCSPMDWSKKRHSFKPCVQTCKSNISLNSNSNRTSRMTDYEEFRRKTDSAIQLSPTDNCCQIASHSHATLSSHFEDNNWDYNQATKGLYLTQPWVRGEYNQTVTDSYAGSVVLKFNSCNEHRDASTLVLKNSSNINSCNIHNSDTDCYA